MGSHQNKVRLAVMFFHKVIYIYTCLLYTSQPVPEGNSCPHLLAILGKVAHRDIAPARAADLLLHALADRVAEISEFITARQQDQR